MGASSCNGSASRSPAPGNDDVRGTSPRRSRRRPACLGAGVKAGPVEPLALQRGEERLAHLVIEAIVARAKGYRPRQLWYPLVESPHPAWLRPQERHV